MAGRGSPENTRKGSLHVEMGIAGSWLTDHLLGKTGKTRRFSERMEGSIESVTKKEKITVVKELNTEAISCNPS